MPPSVKQREIAHVSTLASGINLPAPSASVYYTIRCSSTPHSTLNTARSSTISRLLSYLNHQNLKFLEPSVHYLLHHLLESLKAMGILDTKVPPELLCMIVDCMNPVDKKCFSLTCKQIKNAVNVPKPDLELERVAFRLRLTKGWPTIRKAERRKLRDEARSITFYLDFAFVVSVLASFISWRHEDYEGFQKKLPIRSDTDLPDEVISDFIVDYHYGRMKRLPWYLHCIITADDENPQEFRDFLAEGWSLPIQKLALKFENGNTAQPWLGLTTYYVELLTKNFGQIWPLTITQHLSKMHRRTLLEDLDKIQKAAKPEDKILFIVR